MEFKKITWDQVHEWSIELAKQLCKANRTYIYPWDRGGYVVAGILSHYDCTVANNHKAADVIVDDIADTGMTMVTLFKQPAAVLIMRKGCVPEPAYSAFVETSLDYILFPWQDEEKERQAIEDSGSYRSTSLRHIRRPL